MKKPIFFDTECYPNYWMLGIRQQGGQSHRFAVYEDVTKNTINYDLIKHIFANFQTVSFNGLGYDVSMITGALCGMNTTQLKMLSDRIIVEGIKPWKLGLPEWAPKDHIDLMEVAPGTASLKMYAARIHSKKIQDLPYDPDERLDDYQISEVDKYNDVDLDVLSDLWDALQPQLKLRIALTDRYGIDLRSKSDAQIAEAVLKHRCEKKLGRKLYKVELSQDFTFKYEKPDFVKFMTPQLQNLLDVITGCTFGLNENGEVAMPEAIEQARIALGQSEYNIGIGGLHSNEKTIAHFSDDEAELIDNDVASYYPNLILNSKKHPPALGEQFGIEYNLIVAERLENKANVKVFPEGTREHEDAKTGNDVGKIMINSGFGKTGSKYSILFAPTMMIQTTITGQLSLLMLIEAMEMVGIPVISANTDGVVAKCPKDKIESLGALISAWQKRTGLQMEASKYKAIYSRDVNSYIAIKDDSSPKRKGKYAQSGLVEKKNPDAEICTDAIALWLDKGVPVEKTIRECTDIRKFVTVRKVSGGGVKMWGEGADKNLKVKEIEPILISKGWVKSGRRWERDGIVMKSKDAYAASFAEQRPEYLGKVVRWYYGTNSPGSIVYKTNGNVVGKSYGATPCMVLPDQLPDDIDYDWYLKESVELIKDIGVEYES